MYLEDLIGKDLKGFTVQELTEVFRVDEDGRKTKSIGFFRNGIIAKAFVQNSVDAAWHKTDKALILTDGKVGFRLLAGPVELFDDEKTALEIREKALAKLSPEERTILKVQNAKFRP